MQELAKTVDQERKIKTEDYKGQLIETASDAGDGISGGSMIRGRNPYGSILDGFVYTDIEATTSQQMGKNKDVSIERVYRDMYYHDPIIGSAIEMLSMMPFSDFKLAGAKDRKAYAKYEDSIHNMNIKPLLPVLTSEYLVHGLFVATTMFDEHEGVFTGIVPQQITYVEVQPVPVFGRDPLVTLMVEEAYKSMVKSDDPRMKEYQKVITDAQKTMQPNPDDVIYIPRRALMRDIRGMSILRRCIPTWLLERALFRGTLDQSMKRQRSITHAMVGDTDWTPTQEEMGYIADQILSADMDPVGAILVTRTGVSVNDIRNANDLWKVTDQTDFFTTNKLRAMGVTESLVTGEATYNSLEQSMTAFVEQQRNFRDMLTYEVFYDRTFPKIAEANGYTNRRYGLETASNFYNPDQLEMFSSPMVTQLGYYSDHSSLSREQRRELFIPQIHWQKRLRPEADSDYLGILSTLEEKNVPIDLRTWATAGGLDLDALMSRQTDDIALRKKIKDWLKTIKPAEGEEGGGAPNDGLELSSLTMFEESPGFLSRLKKLDPEQNDIHNIAGGKRHIVSRKGAKILNEKMNKKIAEASAAVGAKVNRLEKRMEEKFAELNTSKIYTG